jgi:pectinesterase
MKPKFSFLLFFFCLSLLSFMPYSKLRVKYDYVVAQDGSGDFKTVQAALDAVPEGNNKPVSIFIKNGAYKEVITVDARKNFISLIGENKDKTILTYNNHAGVTHGLLLPVLFMEMIFTPKT